MEAAGSVAQHHIHPSCLGSLQGVEQHRAGVSPLVLAHKFAAGPLRPDLQLVRRCGPEGVRRAEEDPLALAFQLIAQFADGRGLAYAVDADEQHHSRPGREIQLRAAHVHLLSQNVPEGGLDRLLVLELLLPDPRAEFFHGVQRRVHAQVRQDQRLLQLLEKGLVRLGEAGEEICGDLFQLVKKAHGILPNRKSAPERLIPVQPVSAIFAVFAGKKRQMCPALRAADHEQLDRKARRQQQSPDHARLRYKYGPAEELQNKSRD